MDLLERAGVLGDLHDAMSAVERTGTGRLVFVSGEAGVGKTALVNRFCEQVGGSIRVVVGRCDDLSAPRPLAPFFDLAHMGDGRLGVALDGSERRALFDVLLDEMTGAVIVLEDLQWADDATITVRSAANQTERLLQEIINASGLTPGQKTYLTNRLQTLLTNFNPDIPAHRFVACTAIGVVGSLISGWSGRPIPPALADKWVADARRIRSVLGC